MLNTRHFLFALFLLTAFSAHAATTDSGAGCDWLGARAAGSDKSFLDRLLIRNTFSGNMDQNDPAAVSWQQRSGGGTGTVNVAIQAPDTTCSFAGVPGGLPLDFAPELQYARNTDPSSPLNKLSGGLQGRLTTSIGDVATVAFVLDVLVARDQEARTTPGQGSFLLRPWPADPVPWLFSQEKELGKVVLIRQIMPYLGLEQDGQVKSAYGTHDILFAIVKLQAEEWPLGHRPAQRLQLTGEYVYRHQLAGSSPSLDNVRWLAVGGTYYFDTDESFGLGLTYSEGEDPNADFKRAERTLLSLSFKFGSSDK